MEKRTFTVAKKAQILTNYRKAKDSGKKGAVSKVLAKYGITGSYINQWMKSAPVTEQTV